MASRPKGNANEHGETNGTERVRMRRLQEAGFATEVARGGPRFPTGRGLRHRSRQEVAFGRHPEGAAASTPG